MMTTLADYVGPEFRMDMIRAFGSDAVIPASPEGAAGYDVDDDMYIASHLGHTTGQYLWHKAWLFGLVLDSDVQAQRSCGDLWRPNGHIESAYYIPDDYDTEIELCSIAGDQTI